MKPNFAEMTHAELRSYVLQHRNDLDALEALFSRRSHAEAIAFPPPQSPEEERQQFEIFKHLINQQEGNSNNSAA